MSKLEDVYNEWQNNLAFRTEFNKDPKTALEKAGLQLDANDLQKVQSLLKDKMINEKLENRISK